ncbi:Purine efflux pump PbuE [Ensifer adhaerens]|uniref:MFS transporter n=1 Tax=Ensifer adhaerens TaxID=106592 RepID=UPI00156A6500|nr:MFS transporter [Ensifer adhaerens]NRP18153.1 Purine efflux pump PbuE [Ensifer adhaerens]
MSAVVALSPERTEWIAVTAVVAAGMVAAMQVGKGLIAGPLLQADLGLDLTALGWITSIFAIVGVAGGMPAGAMVAAIGDRRMMVIGMGILLIGILIGAVSPNFSLLILSRLFEGFGFLLVVVAGPAILMRIVAPSRRDLVFALWSCFMPAGMAVAMLSGPLFANWQAIWWGNGLAALLSLLTVIAAVLPSRGGPRASASGIRSDMLTTLTSRGPVLLFALFSLYSLMSFTLSSFLPILLVARMNVSFATAGVLSALITLANVIGNLAAGTMLARGVSRGRLVIVAATLMGAAGLWIFLSQSGDTLTFALCVLFSAIGGLIPATLISTVPIVSPRPELAPMAMGLLMQGSNLGQLVGPVAVGTAIETFGWTSGAGFIGAGALCCILLATMLNRTLRTKPRETA